MKKFWKSVYMSQSCDQKLSVLFFWLTVYIHTQTHTHTQAFAFIDHFTCHRKHAILPVTWLFYLSQVIHTFAPVCHMYYTRVHLCVTGNTHVCTSVSQSIHTCAPVCHRQYTSVHLCVAGNTHVCTCVSQVIHTCTCVSHVLHTFAPVCRRQYAGEGHADVLAGRQQWVLRRDVATWRRPDRCS